MFRTKYSQEAFVTIFLTNFLYKITSHYDTLGAGFCKERQSSFDFDHIEYRHITED